MSESVAWPSLELRTPGAGKVLQEAAEESRRRGHAEGVELGRAEGLAAAEAEINTIRERLEASIRSFSDAQQLETSRLASGLADLARGICHKIMCVELRTNSEVFDFLVTRGMEVLMPAGETVEVRVNAEDHEFLVARGETDVKLLPDADIAVGGVSIGSPEAVVEFDIDSALDEIFK